MSSSEDSGGEDFFGHDQRSEEADRRNREKLETLKSMRENCNWEVEEERYPFFCRFLELIHQWNSHLPDLKNIFRKEEIDYFLRESVINTYDYFLRFLFVKFVARTGYEDEPDVDEDGKPLLHYTTALHHVTCEHTRDVRRCLFNIYNKFDVNYVDDESGRTHFHVACEFECDDAVEKFLELGQDPDCLAQKSFEPPLHLAVRHNRQTEAGLLLRRGADANLTNKDGLTPLHVICTSGATDGTMEIFFEISDEIDQTVRIDAVDNLGRTPLQCAVAYNFPNKVNILLDKGADLSRFVFPAEWHFEERWKSDEIGFVNKKITMASGILDAVDSLEERGYKLDRSDALTIMKLFAKHEIFEKSADVEKLWEEKFMSKAKETMITPTLSLYDLIQLRPKEANRILTYKDYLEFRGSHEFWKVPHSHGEVCSVHMCEKLSSRFFRRWALDSFLELTRYQLPILCCEMIIEKMMNEDLMRICLAAVGQSL